MKRARIGIIAATIFAVASVAFAQGNTGFLRHLDARP